MGIKFALPETVAQVTSVNVRKENHGPDEKVVGTDIDFLVELDADALDQFSLGDEFSFRDAFFSGDTGRPVNVGIASMKIDRVYEEHVISIIHDKLDGDQALRLEAKLKKFTARPIEGYRFELRFQAQTNPEGQSLGFVASSLITGCKVSIEPPAQMDIDDEQENDGD